MATSTNFRFSTSLVAGRSRASYNHISGVPTETSATSILSRSLVYMPSPASGLRDLSAARRSDQARHPLPHHLRSRCSRPVVPAGHIHAHTCRLGIVAFHHDSSKHLFYSFVRHANSGQSDFAPSECANLSLPVYPACLPPVLPVLPCTPFACPPPDVRSHCMSADLGVASPA